MITSCMKLCLVLFVGYILLYIFFVSLSNISEHSDKHQQNLNTRTDVFTDYNCITTLDKIIRKDEEDNFIIPPNDALVQLPIHVLDCLYHRYTTTLQIYCSKRTRHGSLSNGWTICTDGCYRPTVDDHFHVVSSHNDSSSLNDKSVKDVYKSMVHHYTTDLKAADTGQTLSFSSLEDLNESQRTKDVLKVDVGQYTRETVDSILKSGALNSIQQLSLRTQYGDIERTRIDYIPALIHLRQFYDLGFRIYWYRLEWNCVMKVNKNRTNCVYLDMAYKKCRESNGTMEHNHLQIADNSYLKSLRRMALEDVYHKYLASTQTYCKEIIRLGGDRGGWDLCHDVKYRPKYPCLVYSFGINWNFRFDDAIGGAYGCEVHAFDPSMNSTDFQRNAQVKFYNLGLAAMTYTDEKRKWKMSSLLDIRKKLGHETRKLDVIKIDIEWSEWLAVPEMIQSGALRDCLYRCCPYMPLGVLWTMQIVYQYTCQWQTQTSCTNFGGRKAVYGYIINGKIMFVGSQGMHIMGVSSQPKTSSPVTTCRQNRGSVTNLQFLGSLVDEVTKKKQSDQRLKGILKNAISMPNLAPNSDHPKIDHKQLKNVLRKQKRPGYQKSSKKSVKFNDPVGRLNQLESKYKMVSSEPNVDDSTLRRQKKMKQISLRNAQSENTNENADVLVTVVYDLKLKDGKLTTSCGKEINLKHIDDGHKPEVTSGDNSDTLDQEQLQQQPSSEVNIKDNLNDVKAQNGEVFLSHTIPAPSFANDEILKPVENDSRSLNKMVETEECKQKHVVTRTKESVVVTRTRPKPVMFTRCVKNFSPPSEDPVHITTNFCDDEKTSHIMRWLNDVKTEQERGGFCTLLISNGQNKY